MGKGKNIFSSLHVQTRMFGYTVRLSGGKVSA